MKKKADSETSPGSKRDPWMSRVRSAGGTEKYDFHYTCRDCGLGETIRGYSRGASRICGKCNSIMTLDKKRIL